MTTIYFVRHGAYENPDYIFPHSEKGFPLSEEGKRQVKKLGAYFFDKQITAIFSSPILRTRQTAEILGSALHLPVVTDARLREVRTNLEGISMKKFDDTNGELSYLPENLATGAETMEALASRIYGFVEEKRKEYEGKSVLVVTHGDPMRFCVMKYMGQPITFAASRAIATPLAGGYRISFDDEGKATCDTISSL